MGAILSLSASFQIDEDAPEVQTAELPQAPAADALTQDSWSSMFDRATVPTADLPGRARGWLKINGDLGDDPNLHVAAFTYASDMTLLGVSVVPHGVTLSSPGMQAASLDHAIWFHRPVRAADWHLFAMVCHGIISSRGVTMGHVFTPEGIHVASVSQEVLIRRARQP